LDVTSVLDHLKVKNKNDANEIVITAVPKNTSRVDAAMELPKPDLLWENEFLVDSLDTSAIQAATSRDAKLLLGFLKYYGYKEGDSVRDLNAALVKFQQMWGLKADGILDPLTQAHIFRARSANSDVDDDTQPVLLEKIRSGKRNLKYTVTDVDEDLLDVKKKDLGLSTLIGVLDKCFGAWAGPLGTKLGSAITFQYVEPHVPLSEIDVEISWQTFDGVGGTLGYASSKEGLVGCSIQLDRAERWTFDPTKPYSVQSVVTHELGHLFGLHHTNAENSVMFPYYRPDFHVIPQADVDAVAAKLQQQSH